jgi:hypothetical protein
MSKYFLFLVVFLDAVVLFIQTSHISISYEEANLFYGSLSFLKFLVHFSTSIFGQNDFGLRFVMILIHILSVVLTYLISKRYISSMRNRLWLVIVFILLPGVVSSAIIVNNAGVIIFALLLFIYLKEKVSQNILNILLFLYSLIDVHFIYLFIALCIYYLNDKNKKMTIYMLFLALFTVLLHGFDISGTPRGYFLDVLGIYSAIFTPIIFVYIIYALYRRYLTSKIDVVWYIATVSFILSLVLSFRQRVAIEYFAPYLIVALPLAAQLFISSYRVRLKIYRTRYKMIFILSFAFLFFNTFMVFFNKDLYPLIENPKKHFAYNMHVAKELSVILKERAIECVSTKSKMQKRLKFYNISKCSKYLLIENSLNDSEFSNVTISYKGVVVYKANVTNINNL